MREAPGNFPSRAEIRGLVQSLGPTTLFDLFESYGIAEEDRFHLLEETLVLLVVHGHRVRDLPFWFLETLEERCRCFRQAGAANDRRLHLTGTRGTPRGRGGGSAAAGSDN